MLEKFLREVVVIVVGKPAEEIADLLNSKKHINEFVIAKKLDVTINQARNLLYKLSNYGLVSSLRKKDKKKGWFTYFWKIEILKSLEFLRSILINKVEQLKNQIKSRETKQFYVCERCNIEYNEENALLHDFTCNECGEIFTLKDNSKVIREFQREVLKMENEIKLIEQEIEKEKSKLNKEIEKQTKKEAKLKGALRKKEKKKRDRLKKKAEKPKKIPKKKIKKSSKKIRKKIKKILKKKKK